MSRITEGSIGKITCMYEKGEPREFKRAMYNEYEEKVIWKYD